MQGARSLPLPLAGASLAQLCGLSAQARPPKSPLRWLSSLKTCMLRVKSRMPPEQPLPLGAPSCPSILLCHCSGPRVLCPYRTPTQGRIVGSQVAPCWALEQIRRGGV